MKTLLVIDIQKGLFTIPDYPVFNHEALIEKVNLLISKFRAAGLPVIFIQHENPNVPFLKRGADGWKIHDSLDYDENDPAVFKKTPDSFHNTNLLELLKDRNVDELFITGIQTEYCVDTTCRRAFSLGFKTTLVSDSHSTFNSAVIEAPKIIEHHNKIIGTWFAALKNAEEINV